LLFISVKLKHIMLHFMVANILTAVLLVIICTYVAATKPILCKNCRKPGFVVNSRPVVFAVVASVVVVAERVKYKTCAHNTQY